jgi:hypothetical protein
LCIESIPLHRFLWNLIERRVLRRPVAPLLPGHRPPVPRPAPSPDTPGLSPVLCAALARSLQKATPWWIRVRIKSRPGGYVVRVRNVRPPHFESQSSGVVSSGDAAKRLRDEPADAVREILRTVQQFTGEQCGTLWPSSGALPEIADRWQEIAEGGFEQYRAEVLAWFEAFPEAHARAEGVSVRAWFGQEEAPVLRLPLLPIS